MSIRVPQGCKTPKADREEYALTMSDIRFMQKQLEKVWDMISYYANMPENRTCELIIRCRDNEKSENMQEALNKLLERSNDIDIALNDITWRYD